MGAPTEAVAVTDAGGNPDASDAAERNEPRRPGGAAFVDDALLGLGIADKAAS